MILSEIMCGAFNLSFSILRHIDNPGTAMCAILILIYIDILTGIIITLTVSQPHQLTLTVEQ